MDAYLMVRPEDWIRQTVSRIGTATNFDGSIAGTIYYVGPSGTVATLKVATTTCDMTFKFGATSTAAASSATLGLCPTTCPTGTTAASLSTIDLSSAGVSTIYKLQKRINQSRYFKFVPKDLLPGDPVETAAGTGYFLPQNTTAQIPTTGYDLSVDHSLHGAQHIVPHFWAGLTLGGDPAIPRTSDVNVLHEILQVQYGAMFATVAGSLAMYECDDILGTSTLLETKSIAIAAATSTVANYWSQSTEPNKSTKGKRFVCKLSGGSITTATALRNPTINIIARSSKFGPAVRKDRFWSSLMT